MTQLGQCGNKQSGKQTNGLTASFFRLRLPFPAFSPNQKLAQPTFCRVWPARGWHTVVFCFFCFFCFFWFSYVFLQFLKLSTLAALVFLVFAHETKKNKETKVDNFKNCKNALENQKKQKKQKKQNTSACHPLAGHTRQKLGCASFWFGTYLRFMLHHVLILMQNKMNIQLI